MRNEKWRVVRGRDEGSDCFLLSQIFTIKLWKLLEKHSVCPHPLVSTFTSEISNTWENHNFRLSLRLTVPLNCCSVMSSLTSSPPTWELAGYAPGWAVKKRHDPTGPDQFGADKEYRFKNKHFFNPYTISQKSLVTGTSCCSTVIWEIRITRHNGKCFFLDLMYGTKSVHF